jgi:hypothetical protein
LDIDLGNPNVVFSAEIFYKAKGIFKTWSVKLNQPLFLSY